jgi:hypothetical protein
VLCWLTAIVFLSHDILVLYNAIRYTFVAVWLLSNVPALYYTFSKWKVAVLLTFGFVVTVCTVWSVLEQDGWWAGVWRSLFYPVLFVLGQDSTTLGAEVACNPAIESCSFD